MSFLKVYGDTEGPLGFPMKDADAKALDKIMTENPDHEFSRITVEKAMTEFSPGERADVSWICTEAVDRHREVVLVAGFNDEQFKANPIVTLNHDYTKEPVGRSIWRKKIRNQHIYGIKAKTTYPAKPEDWAEKVWAPDQAFALIQAGLMTGKSIGFLTMKHHSPTEKEIIEHPEWKGVTRVVDQWLLLEYCCTWLPINPQCITEAVSKSLVPIDTLKWCGIDLPQEPETAQEPIIPHTPLSVLEARLTKAIQGIDMETIIKKATQDALDVARGRV